MNSTTTRISAAQLAVLLVLSRLFILLIFVPDTAQAPSGTTALLGIVLGYLLTILLLLPLWKLMQQHPDMDLVEIARQRSEGLGKLTALVCGIICLLASAETAAQFIMFITSAIYPEAEVLCVALIFCAAVVYMVYLGLEAMGRAAAIFLVGAGVSAAFIALGLFRFTDTLSLISPFYQGAGAVVFSTLSYFTHNVELIALALLVSNLPKGKARSAFLRYHTLISLILFVVGLMAIMVLGYYSQTRSFPIYTMFVLSGSNVFYRFDYLFILIWVATAMVRAALYLLLACRMAGRWSRKQAGFGRMLAGGALITGIAVGAVKRLKLFRALYGFLEKGLPVFLLLVLLPVGLLMTSKEQQPKQEGR